MAAAPPANQPPRPGDHRSWFQSLQVKGDFQPGTLDEYFETVQRWLSEDMAFLRAPIRSRRLRSHLIRGAAFAALVAGVLLPLPIFETPANRPDGLDLAYLAVIIGGLILVWDELFNVSRSWVRLTLSELQMKQIRYRLDLEWARTRPLLTVQNADTQGPLLIQLLSNAMDAGHQIMTAQATAWTSEMAQALDALRTRLEADRTALDTMRVQREQEQARPTTGAVNIRIDDPSKLQPPLRIIVSGIPGEETLETIPGVWPVTAIPSGQQKMFLKGTRKGPPAAPFEDGRAVTVKRGEVTEVVFAV